jgi:hypothetical protein
MTLNYAYAKEDNSDDIPSGKIRSENWHEECFQDYRANTGRGSAMRTVTDPATNEVVTKMVQVDNDGKEVTIRCSSFIDHPTKNERAYLIEDTTATSSLFTLNMPNYISASKQAEYNWEFKTKIELEALGFVFDEEV